MGVGMEKRLRTLWVCEVVLSSFTSASSAPLTLFGGIEGLLFSGNIQFEES